MAAELIQTPAAAVKPRQISRSDAPGTNARFIDHYGLQPDVDCANAEIIAAAASGENSPRGWVIIQVGTDAPRVKVS